MRKYLVRFSFYAGKWWTGEVIPRTDGFVDIDRVTYHPNWQAAIKDFNHRIMESADYYGN